MSRFVSALRLVGIDLARIGTSANGHGKILCSTCVSFVRYRRSPISKRVEPEFVDYCDFISCLHAVEHFGLGPVKIVECVEITLGIETIAVTYLAKVMARSIWPCPSALTESSLMRVASSAFRN